MYYYSLYVVHRVRRKLTELGYYIITIQVWYLCKIYTLRVVE